MRYDRSDWLWILFAVMMGIFIVRSHRVKVLNRRITECEQRLTVLELKAAGK